MLSATVLTHLRVCAYVFVCVGTYTYVHDQFVDICQDGKCTALTQEVRKTSHMYIISTF